MVEEKLPKELAAKKLELQAYEEVINERNIDTQYLNNLQNKVNQSKENHWYNSHVWTTNRNFHFI